MKNLTIDQLGCILYVDLLLVFFFFYCILIQIRLFHLQCVEEKCVYSVNPENSKWTLCDKTAYISSSIFGFGSAIQAFGLERFKKNSLKASSGFEYVLEKLFMPGHLQITHTDNFKDKAIKVAQAAKEKAQAAKETCKEKAQQRPIYNKV